MKRTIKIEPGALHELTTKAELALIESGANLFVWGEKICTPVVDEVEAARGCRTKVARLKEVTVDGLLDHLSRAAKWKRLDGREGKIVNTNPPRYVASTLLSRNGELNLRKLAGVITNPTLRPDGSLLIKPGYDESTRLFLVDGLHFPTISPKPTRKDALNALKDLDEVLSEFAFVDDASKSVALSAIITPIVRGAISVAPIHVVRSHTAGSGKSYLVDLCSMVCSGQAAPVLSAGAHEEELEKRLGAALLTGQPIISVDNVNDDLGGAALCQFVERPIVEIRILGRSENTRIENRATLYATGNNICLKGDMSRRALMCTIDPKMERPELRQFKINPLMLIQWNRGKYIGAILTIVRAYLTANCPDELPALGSFGEWSRLVRSAIVWLGRTDPAETIETAREEDPENSMLKEFVAAWLSAVGPEIFLSARKLIEKAGTSAFYEVIQSVAGERPGTVDSRKLGIWLKRRKGQISHGVRIEARENTHAKQKEWGLVPAGGAGTCGYELAQKNKNVMEGGNRDPLVSPHDPAKSDEDQFEPIVDPDLDALL